MALARWEGIGGSYRATDFPFRLSVIELCRQVPSSPMTDAVLGGGTPVQVKVLERKSCRHSVLVLIRLGSDGSDLEKHRPYQEIRIIGATRGAAN